MTSRERLLKTLAGEKTDYVPVMPDTSNMIPAKLTGKPFWDIYLYKDIPHWQAYIRCAKKFGYDSLMDGYAAIRFEEFGEIDMEYKEAIVFQNEERIITRRYKKQGGRMIWTENTTVYYRDMPPTYNLHYTKAKVDETPATYEDVTPRTLWPEGEELLRIVKSEMGDQGLVGVFCGYLSLICSEQGIYNYYDDPESFEIRAIELLERSKKKLHKLMSLPVKPDFICLGSSGSQIFNTPDMFRKLSFPYLKEMTALCKAYGIPSHVHSCGPEKRLVKMAAEETDLTIIDPLEIPPMGDCNLKELKQLYGHKLVLKGNIHTTDVMLRGSTQDVVRASKQAIDDAAEGGRFILSTGDECGRDTPLENIEAMIDTARTYGKY